MEVLRSLAGGTLSARALGKTVWPDLPKLGALICEGKPSLGWTLAINNSALY